MAKRKVTRAELVQALKSVGIYARKGQGMAAVHQFNSASIVGLDMFGEHVKLNGESDDKLVCLIVEEE